MISRGRRDIAREINYVRRNRCFCARAVSQLQLHARAASLSRRGTTGNTIRARGNEAEIDKEKWNEREKLREIRERRRYRNRVSRRVRSRRALGAHLRLAYGEGRSVALMP